MPKSAAERKGAAGGFMINRKRYTTVAKVFLAMHAIAVIVTVAALVHVL